ncbi:MAG: hypothetical protein K5839_00045 [Treponemataceae bacterium]|nr:hypothetical protein [Treponemataceae bacterium]
MINFRKFISSFVFICLLSFLFVNNSFAEELDSDSVTNTTINSSNKTNSWGRVFTFDLGADYVYDYSLTSASSYESFLETFPKLDTLGIQGHLFRIFANFEWRFNAFSFSVISAMTMNFMPAMFDCATTWIPPCWDASVKCFDAMATLCDFDTYENWLIANVCTLFIPWFLCEFCVFTGALACLTAIPGSFVVLCCCCLNAGGSFDYHPYSNDWMDTKLSLGLDFDGYKLLVCTGLIGVYAQAEVSFFYKQFKGFIDAGYRADIINISLAAQGTSEYTPEPFVKAGLCWHLEKIF